MQNTPLVSIVVPCYNQAPYLPDALQSVLDQTYRNWECIMVNDGSPDNTEEIAKEWLNKDTRFKYIHKENSGVCDTRNLGIKNAKGEFILPLDGDDKLHKDYLQYAMAVFETKKGVKLVYCDPIMFGTKNEIVKSRAYNYQMLLIDNTIPCSGVFRKEDFLKTNGYNPNMTMGLEDWDFWVSFLDKDNIVIKLDENLVYYRIKEESRSTIIKEQDEKNEAMLLQIFRNNQEKYLNNINPIRSKIQADFYKQQYLHLQQSTEYTIGKIICCPFRLTVKALKRIFNPKKR